MKEELLKGLAKEQVAKLRACKNNEEILKAVKEEGVELNDEQLEAVSGGECSISSGISCPKCNQTDVDRLGNTVGWDYTCKSCGYTWFQDTIKDIKIGRPLRRPFSISCSRASQ